MKQNMGNIDKAVRIIAAVIIGGFYFTNFVAGVLSIVLLALAGILILTSLIGFCPLYFPFKISTKGKLNLKI